MTRAHLAYLEGRIAVALARQASLRDDVDTARSQRRIVARMAGRLARLPVAMAAGCGQVLEGCFALLEDDRQGAGERWRQALGSFERLEMRLHAESVRYRLAELTGDEAMLARAVAWFRGQGVVDPARLVEVQVPRGQ